MPAFLDILLDGYPPTKITEHGAVIESTHLFPSSCGTPGYADIEIKKRTLYLGRLFFIGAAIAWGYFGYYILAGISFLFLLPFLFYSLREDYAWHLHSRRIRLTFHGHEMILEHSPAWTKKRFYLDHHESRFVLREHSRRENEEYTIRARRTYNSANNAPLNLLPIYGNSYELILDYGGHEVFLTEIFLKPRAEKFFTKLNIIKRLLDTGVLPYQSPEPPDSRYPSDPAQLRSLQADFARQRDNAKDLPPLIRRSLELLDLPPDFDCQLMDHRYHFLNERLHPSTGGSMYLRLELQKARRFLRIWRLCPYRDSDETEDTE